MGEGTAGVFSSEYFREQGHRVVDLLADFLQQSTGGDAIEPVEKVLDFRNENDAYREWKSVAPGSLSLDELFGKVLGQSIRLHHPRYLGHQISPPAVDAAIAGLVADLMNNGMGVYEMGMAGTAVERVVVEIVARQLGFNDSAGGYLTSGGSLGNLTALLAARNDRVPGAISEGTRQPLAVLVSEQAHYCVQRAVGVMGWGKEGLVTVPCDNRFRMDTGCLPSLLKKTESSGRKVVAVVGSACSTATGSYDNLREIGEFCRDHELWFHVDGAHGAAVAFSEKFRDLVDGIDLADSVVLDFHKLLLTPALATALVFRDGRHSYGTFAQKADYLFSEEKQDEQWHNLALRTFECTKVMMSLKVFSIFAMHGIEAWDNNVTRLYELARQFAEIAEQTERIELMLPPQANIVCYRYLPDREERANEINARIRNEILETGRFYIVQTSISEKHWLRSTIGSALSTPREFRELFEDVIRIGRQLEQC